MARFSPPARILLYLLLVTASFLSHSLRLDAVLVALTMAAASGVPFRTLRKGFFPISLILFFTLLSNMLFQTGRVVYESWGITVTEEGVSRGVHLTLRLFILILGAKVLTATTPSEDLVNALARCLGPLGKRKSVRDFLSTLTLTLRFLPMVYAEARTLYREAVQSSPSRTIRDRISLSASLITPLLKRSIKRADELSRL